MPRIKYLRILLIGFLTEIILWCVACMYVAYLGITVQKFETISPPSAFWHSGRFLEFGLRLVGHDIFPGWLGATLVVIAPLLIIIVSITYLVLKRKQGRGYKIVLTSVGVILAMAAANIGGLAVIPGVLTRGIYQIKASRDMDAGIARLGTIRVITDTDEVLKQIKDVPTLNVFTEYGTSGSILAALVDEHENASTTYTHFQSFFLPLYVRDHPRMTGRTDIDSAPLIFVGDRELVFGVIRDKETLKKVLLPIAIRIIRNAYPDRVTSDQSPLKSFFVIDDAEFKGLYLSKVRADIQRDITQLEIDLTGNQRIIDAYPATRKENEDDYRKFVTDQETEYQRDCVAFVRYANCPEWKQTIEKSRVTVQGNMATADKNYQLAQQYNADIRVSLADRRARLAEASIDDASQSIEAGKGEYSNGIAFSDNSVYLRYYPESPVNAEAFRIVVHELMHVYSHGRTHELPTAIDEGATDLLSLKAMKYSDLDAIRMSGYPIEMQIVMALLEKISFAELQDLYFKTGEPSLKKLMEDRFPSVNYVEFTRKIQKIFEGTYHQGGYERSFDSRLIDHDEVVQVRRMLGLSDFKFEDINF